MKKHRVFTDPPMTVPVVFILALLATFFAQGCANSAGRSKPAEGFVSLFNGKDLTGWKGLVGDPVSRAKMSSEELAKAQARADELMHRHWKIENGTLVYRGHAYDNICTAKDYADFELLVDWKIEADADSGLYLRGTPQVQIWDAHRNDIGSGGLFNNKNNPDKPVKVADKPVGEWNTFKIIMIGKLVIVYLNDQLVVDTTELENFWQRDREIYPTGQIELQAHNSVVYFRNIFIRELK